MMALPALSIQQKIVAEIEAEQALVDGNRELIERFEEKIRDAVGRVWGEDETKEKSLPESRLMSESMMRGYA